MNSGSSRRSTTSTSALPAGQQDNVTNSLDPDARDEYNLRLRTHVHRLNPAVRERVQHPQRLPGPAHSQVSVFRTRITSRRVRYGRSGRGMDTAPRGRECRDALQVDLTTADRADHLPTLLQHSARDQKCVAVRTCLSQQCAGLGALIGDRRAFRIVLVIRGDQLGSLDDGGDDGFEGCNLTGSPLPLGLDDRQDALDVERVHPDERGLCLDAPQRTNPTGIRERQRRLPVKVSATAGSIAFATVRRSCRCSPYARRPAAPGRSCGRKGRDYGRGGLGPFPDGPTGAESGIIVC